MKKHTVAIVAAILASFALTACGGKEEESTTLNVENQSESNVEAKEETKDEELFTCLISEAPAGVPFTDLTWTGFERIADTYGAEVKLIEALDKAEYAEQIRAMADMGANPIYTMFDAVNAVAIELAPEYPDTKFCLIDSSMDTLHENVANVYVDSLEPAFIAGVVAAKTTSTKKVGWIGSLDIPVINRFKDAYLAGVKYTDPEIEIQTAYVGDDSDTVKAGEQAKIMINRDVDVIYQTANLAGLGVIQACSEAKVKCIGVDEWQGGIDPCVFWSSLTDINGAVFDSFTAYREGKFTAGRTNYGIETESAIFDQRDYDALPDDVKKEVDCVMAEVKEGKLDLEKLLKEN